MKTKIFFIVLSLSLTVSCALLATTEGNVQVGYTWTSVFGNTGHYLSTLPVEDGLHLESLALRHRSSKQRFSLIARGWGNGQPDRTLHFSGKTGSRLRYLLDYREDRYFYDLSGYDAQFHRDDLTYKRLNARISYAFSASWEGYLRLRRGHKSGNGLRTFYLMGTITPLARAYDDTLSTFAAGVRFHAKGFLLELEEAINRREQNGHFGESGVSTQDLQNIQYVQLTNLRRYNDENETYPETTMRFHWVKKSFFLKSTISYSDYSGVFHGSQAYTFNFGPEYQLPMEGADATRAKRKRTLWNGGLAASFTPWEGWTFEDRFTYHDQSIDGDLARAGYLDIYTEDGTPFLNLPYDVTSATGFDKTTWENAFTLSLRLFGALNLYATHTYGKRDMTWFGQTPDEESEEVVTRDHRTEKSIEGGLSWHDSTLDFSAGYESGDFSTTLLATEPLDYDGAVFRAKWKLSKHLHFSGHYRDRENDSDAYHFKFKSWSVTGVLLAGGASFNAGFQKDRYRSDAPIITYDPYETQGLSRYRSTLETTFFYVDLPEVRGFTFTTGASSVRDDDDTFPFRFEELYLNVTSPALYKEIHLFARFRRLIYHAPSNEVLNYRASVATAGFSWSF